MPTTIYPEMNGPAPARRRTPLAPAVDVTCLRELDAQTESIWNSLRTSMMQSDLLLDNGHFHPEFSKAVARVRDDVHYAVIQQEGRISGILPFQRPKKTVAHPVGGMMNDFHGLIGIPESGMDVRLLLEQLGLRQFHFHALQSDFGCEPSRTSLKTVFRKLDCPFINLLPSGFEYHDWVSRHSSTVRRQPQKARAMIRDLGPLRLEPDCRDPRILEQLIEMKRAKFVRTRTFDLLGVPWTVNLLREIFETRTSDFQGMLSVLWAGDELVSGHFGFRCGSALHFWFPAHDHQHRKYSPGTQLMIELTRAAAECGITRIDLGYGKNDLKDRFANGMTSVEYGVYGLNPISRTVAHGQYEFRQALKRIPAKNQFKKLVRPVLPNLGKGKFR